MTTRTHQRLRGDAGNATAMAVLLTGMVLALIALLSDGGRVLAARRHTDNLARQAARVAAQQVAIDDLREGRSQLDPAAAHNAAVTFLVSRGIDPNNASVETSGMEVWVTVQRDEQTPMWAIFGTPSKTITARQYAQAHQGPPTP